MKIQITVSDVDLPRLVRDAVEKTYRSNLFSASVTEEDVTGLCLLSIAGVDLVHFPKAGFARFAVASQSVVGTSSANLVLMMESFVREVNQQLR